MVHYIGDWDVSCVMKSVGYSSCHLGSWHGQCLVNSHYCKQSKPSMLVYLELEGFNHDRSSRRMMLSF